MADRSNHRLNVAISTCGMEPISVWKLGTCMKMGRRTRASAIMQILITWIMKSRKEGPGRIALVLSEKVELCVKKKK